MKKIFILLFLVLISLPFSLAELDDKTVEYLNLNWWKRFSDDNLVNNILLVYQNNYDLKNSTLKIKESEKIAKMQFAQELPELYFSGDLNRDLRAPVQQFGSMRIPNYSQYNYHFPLTFAYEIDIWGLNKLKTKSAKEQIEIVKQAQRSVYITLTSDFAIDYYNLIKADRLIEIQKELVSIQERIVSMTKDKFETGLCSIEELLSEEKMLTILKEEENKHNLARQILKENLKVYLASDNDIKRSEYENISLLNNIPLEYNSTIVENRPDFKQAESDIKRIGFDVQAAKREFLPKFTLIGQIGLNAYHLGTLFNSTSQFLNLGILPSMDLFSGGRKIAFLKLKKFEYEKALNEYQKTILVGLKEVNSSIFEYKTVNKNYLETLDRLKTQNKLYSLTKDKNNIGAIADIDVLFAKQALLNIEKEEVSNKINSIVATIGLYKSIGGVDLYNIEDI